MIKLTRTVRFCLNPEITTCYVRTSNTLSCTGSNTYASSPNYTPFAQYNELDVTCYGNIDIISGYFINIKEIDNAVRIYAIPKLQENLIDLKPPIIPQYLIPDIFHLINSKLNNTVISITWKLTPYHHITFENKNTTMPKCIVNQQFEFAASHRLHCPSLSDTQNQKLFGKCNRPNGHGHNYRIEVAISTHTTNTNNNNNNPSKQIPEQQTPVNLNLLEDLVNQTIIEKFDHTYLNVDCEEFKDLNPTVENIAMICHKLLKPELEKANMPLHHVTVWETDKTSCTYTE